MRDDSQVTFVGIDKSEQKVLMSYLKSKNVRLRTVDIETNQHIDFSDEGEDQDEGTDEKKDKSKGDKQRSGKAKGGD